MRNKLLLITDKAEVRALFEEMLLPLLEQGCELFFTENAQGALEIVAKEQPALIFIDSDRVQEFPFQEKSHLIWMKREGEACKEGDDVLFVPFTFVQLFQKIDPFLRFETPTKTPLL